MKKNVVIISIICLILFEIFSCVKQPCEKLTCENKGVKYFDTDKCYCKCPMNTRGENCEINLWDSIESNYSELDSCTLINSVKYISQVDTSLFSVENLGNYTCTSGNYSILFSIKDTFISIDSQVICPMGGPYLFYGSGKYDYITKKININYFVNYFIGGSNQIDTCKVFYMKL